MYDIAIIGGGPAGVSAAINAKILNKSFIWLSSGSVSKKAERAETVRNYPALPDIKGTEFVWALKNHTESMGIELTQGVVTGVYQTDGNFSVLSGENVYEAKSVILCLGVESVKPLDGEDKFLGRGVSYCATCDGFLYKGKTIAVLCTDKNFEHEIEYLSNLAEKTYVIPLYKNYKITSEKAEIVLKNPIKLEGDSRLKEIIFKDGRLEVDGMFILRGSVSPSALVHGLETQDGHIAVKRDCSTNIEGLFAAGDCTGRPYQYAKAVGEGNVAVHSAVEYLARKR